MQTNKIFLKNSTLITLEGNFFKKVYFKGHLRKGQKT